MGVKEGNGLDSGCCHYTIFHAVKQFSHLYNKLIIVGRFNNNNNNNAKVAEFFHTAHAFVLTLRLGLQLTIILVIDRNFFLKDQKYTYFPSYL